MSQTIPAASATILSGRFAKIARGRYGNNNNWINIKCVGTVSNRTAIGAHIRAKATISGAAVWQTREIAQQSGGGGHNSLRVHFGFGDATVIDSLVIRWPTTMTEVYTNVAINQFLTAIEGHSLTSVTEEQGERPAAFSLSQNYPNPFNPSTTIRYALPHAGVVTLKIFDVQGQELVTLVNEKQPAGEHAISWRADGLPSGLYLYRLQVGDWMETRKMILAK